MNEQVDRRVLYGDRVVLRLWQRRDTHAQELWPRYTEPFSSLWNIPRSISFDEEMRSGWSSQRYAWAVEDRHQRLIGRISLREIDPRQQSARLGISLAQPYVGQGLGTEALARFLEHFFGPLDYLTMYLDVAAFNERAVRSYESLGFEYLNSEWRRAGRDPSLYLLDNPEYKQLLPFFRRGRFETMVEFYEMALTRATWQLRT